MNGFYIGYAQQVPMQLARFMRRVIIVFAFLAIALALLLVELGQLVQVGHDKGDDRPVAVARHLEAPSRGLAGTRIERHDLPANHLGLDSRNAVGIEHDCGGRQQVQPGFLVLAVHDPERKAVAFGFDESGRLARTAEDRGSLSGARQDQRAGFGIEHGIQERHEVALADVLPQALVRAIHHLVHGRLGVREGQRILFNPRYELSA